MNRKDKKNRMKQMLSLTNYLQNAANEKLSKEEYRAAKRAAKEEHKHDQKHTHDENCDHDHSETP